MNVQAEATVKKTKGLGGWLIWPTIILVLSPLSLLASDIGIFKIIAEAMEGLAPFMEQRQRLAYSGAIEDSIVKISK